MEQVINGNGDTRTKVAVLEADLKHLEERFDDIKGDIGEVRKDIKELADLLRTETKETRKEIAEQQETLTKHEVNLKWINRLGGSGGAGTIIGIILALLGIKIN